jgi:nucleoside-diphosphate-sugar epimerase
MKIVITGGAGFLGQRLARQLLSLGSLPNRDGQPQAISKIMLVDVLAAPDLNDPLIEQITGDIADASLLARAIDAGTDVVFHLAAIVSGHAEADFDLGMRVNLDASRLVLERCRASGSVPRVIFTSSVAVFGGDLPAVIQENTALNPQSSYGIQKAIAELLLQDYTRKGFIDGRVLRLPTISVRPGKPNRAASSFASGIIREPLNGQPAICPVSKDVRVWLLSPRKAIDCLLNGYKLSPQTLGRNRVINLPGVSVSAGEMVDALKRVAGAEISERITWQRDADIERIVGSWPGAWNAERANSLGFSGDRSFDDIIRNYIEDDLTKK